MRYVPEYLLFRAGWCILFHKTKINTRVFLQGEVTQLRNLRNRVLKSAVPETAPMVVEFKTEMEKISEQIQNIE